ncbi:MAG: alpha/beta hydrolase [Bacteroidaceae bacterium]|nr:alpha/beta hydrolase [Bacteroidaceae bacterium]
MSTKLRPFLLVLLLAVIAQYSYAGKKLSARDADAMRQRIISEWKAEQRQKLRKNEEKKSIQQGDNAMPYWFTTYGQEPLDGRSLWISMHGGGGAPKALNDQQWENQKLLYKPAEGIYCAPRAPWDAWNMWFQDPIDEMFEELIRTMVVFHNVNPDKVYLMGYSAGGDGVWRLAPRLADHWASASMMAGHPGDVSLVNVRNLPFTIWCGALDAAYNRNKEVAKRGIELDSLQRNDPLGYEHECHIVEGMEHWMQLKDAAAVPWMAQHVRNPYPKHVVWQQEEVLRPNFYWLQVPREEMKRGKKVIASIEENVITIQHCDYSQLTILLNDNLLNLDKPIKVLYEGRTQFKGKVARTEENLRNTLKDRNDPSYVFPAAITIKTK